jgi:hypothetical protein
MLPMTALFGILPLLNQLIKLDKDAESKKSETELSDAEVDEIVRVWELRHFWRFLSYVPAWGCAMAALMLDGRA